MIPYSLNPLGVGDPYLTDLDILRQIRDANPTSQLPALWLDSEDPYTQWWNATESVGVLFGGDLRLDQFAVDSDMTIPAIAERDPLKVYVLSIAGTNINTLQNVNKLTALRCLDCNSTQLTSLNVTGLRALQQLYCNFNQLTSLNVTGLTALRYLACNANQLTSLDVTGLTALQQLTCDFNQLTSLNVTGLTALRYLDCNSNQLTSFNVTGLTGLHLLICSSNQLTSLNVTELTALPYLDCSSNQLTSLDLTGLTALQLLICSSNQLTSLSTLTSKGLITFANFTRNLMPTTETNRLVSLGFTPAQVLPQNI